MAKNQNFHRCPNCGRLSAVRIHPLVFRIFIVIQIIAIITFVFAIIMGGKYCLFGAGIVVLLSLVFYGFSPYTVRLLKPKLKNDEEREQSSKAGLDSDSEIYSN